MKTLDLSLCVVFYSIGTFFAIRILNDNGLIDFLKPAHYYSLVLLLFAGVISWISMVWMLNPSDFKVNDKQKISLGLSIVISVLLWARYAFTIAENQTGIIESQSNSK